jgi:hypothetical protein
MNAIEMKDNPTVYASLKNKYFEVKIISETFKSSLLPLN